ncbi:hypothetical protein LIER_29304 [Lithospermum erythrorhizon]|uniref:Transmembrane protein n=1 Tax=Lithospermum erythrorhizon TaxID=34254 RepID=A0AAV3RKB8_LITER
MDNEQGNDQSNYSNSTYYDYYYLPCSPQQIYLLFLMGAILFLLILKWYINYEILFEDLMDKLKLCLIIVPVLLLLVVHWLSTEDKERVPLYISLPKEQEAFHKVGGSPLGIGLLLLFLIFLVPNHASMQERLFPLFSRR